MNRSESNREDRNEGDDRTGQPSPGPSAEKPPKPKLSETRPLRVWPAVLLLVCLWSVRAVPMLTAEMTMPILMIGFMGPLVFVLLLVLWWIVFSRATIGERTVGVLGLLAIGFLSSYLADKSIRGFGTLFYAMPWGITAFTAVLVCAARRSPPVRTGFGLLAALVAFGFWDLVRTEEVWGDFRVVRSWRWEPTAEERFLVELDTRDVAIRADEDEESPSTERSIEAARQWLTDPEWPEFRGPRRDGSQPNVVLREDWETHPPREQWRIRVGPGWSSFSVAGNLLFTQQQRGEYEAVVCYDARTGAEVWVHQDESRFWEAVGGPGPRATPTLSDGMLLALGANGLLNRLDPVTGEPIWQRDIGQDAGREPPTWGFASSPLVVSGSVIVHAGGSGDKGVLAYDVENGEPVWSAPAGDHSYSSPQLAEVQGMPCVLTLTNKELTFVDPADGTLVARHDWPTQTYRIVQPLVLDGASVLLGTAMGEGTRRIEVRRDDQGLTTTESWTSSRMSPYYNDYVAHRGYLYGFDNNIFACLDLATGERKWKRGRYGNGQVLLLPKNDQLLVLSEDGELVLLRATPERHTEIARHRVLEGRTWNHPVVVGDRLYVRNSEEAACYVLPVVDGSADGSAASRSL